MAAEDSFELSNNPQSWLQSVIWCISLEVTTNIKKLELRNKVSATDWLVYDKV